MIKRKNFYHLNRLNLNSIDINKVNEFTKLLANSYPKNLAELKSLEDLMQVVDDLIIAYETDPRAEKPRF